MIGLGTDLWSADGNFEASADGFPGWSADGYEPNPLFFAVLRFAAVGVNIGTITYVYSTVGTPVGWVITGYVPLLTSAPAGSYVNLVVSNGPAPAPTPSIVPNVVGEYYYDAQLAILQAGMLIQPPKFVVDTAVNPGYVIAQSLVAGTQVNPQTPMTITVSGFLVTNQPGVIVPVP